MAKPSKPQTPSHQPPRPPGMSQEKFDRLVGEVRSPFKGFRRVIYGAVGASGLVGAFIFFTQLLAGRDVDSAISNLAVQLGVIGIVAFLFWLEGRGNSDA